MREAKITIVNRLGLHARAAAKFVNLAKTFSSQVELTRDVERVDGKSIMSVMLLAAPIGTDLLLHVTGPDEDEAFEALAQLVADRFGEGE
jgi:phosphocarrier protein HPr